MTHLSICKQVPGQAVTVNISAGSVSGMRLTINLEVNNRTSTGKQGSIAVEVLHGGECSVGAGCAPGSPVTGYSLADCTEPAAVDGYNVPVRWRGGERLPKTLEGNIMLRFVLLRARFYSYTFLQ